MSLKLQDDVTSVSTMENFRDATMEEGMRKASPSFRKKNPKATN